MTKPNPQYQTTAQATPEELKSMKHRCYCWPNCRGYALFDEVGYKKCLKHLIRDYRWDGRPVTLESFWSTLKYTRVII